MASQTSSSEPPAPTPSSSNGTLVTSFKIFLISISVLIASLVPHFGPYHHHSHKLVQFVSYPFSALLTRHSPPGIHDSAQLEMDVDELDSILEECIDQTQCKKEQEIHPEQSLLRAVIFDAGSTGSRIHVYKFIRVPIAETISISEAKPIQETTSTKFKLHLEGERFEFTSPGLSFYAKNITGAATSLIPLLNAANEEVPEQSRSRTPLLLRATAGLRLLSEETADAIINEVRKLLHSTLFLTRPKQSEEVAEILSGTDEGVYGWYTVNFLLEQLHEPYTSAVTLDLGGGSTQITFATMDHETIESSPSSFIQHHTTADGLKYTLYSNSYLGYGLMSARKTILLSPSSASVVYTDDGHVVIDNHPCFASSRGKNWTYEGVMYSANPFDPTLKMELNQKISFKECMALARDFVRNGNIHHPKELLSRDIYAMSYYFDRAQDSAIIPSNVTQAVVTVRDMVKAAKKACTGSGPVKRAKAFLCLDLSYISSLLEYGYGLNRDKKINLVKKINGIETSWALGAALNLLGGS